MVAAHAYARVEPIAPDASANATDEANVRGEAGFGRVCYYSATTARSRGRFFRIEVTTVFG